MPFSKTKGKHDANYWTNFYEEFIVKALKNCGYDAYKSVANLNNIAKDIIQQLASSDIVLAVLTDSNANVFYELGVRHCLHRGTIMILEEGKRAPFDIGQHGILFYRSTDSGYDLSSFTEDLKVWIQKAEKMQEDNLVWDSLKYQEISEVVNLSFATCKHCVDLILNNMNCEGKSIEEKLEIPLALINHFNDDLKKRGHANARQVSIIHCDHKWQKERLLVHLDPNLKNVPSSEWWKDVTLNDQSVFHEIIKRRGSGFRLVQIGERVNRLTAVTFETVDLQLFDKCVVVSEAHYYQR